MPLIAQRLHGVGVPVEVDDLLVVRVDAVVDVLHGPHQVAELVETDVVSVPDRADLDDPTHQHLQTWAFVVAEPGLGVTALILGQVDLVGRDPYGLLQDLHGEWAVSGGQFGDPFVE